MWEIPVWIAFAAWLGHWNFKPYSDEEILAHIFNNIDYKKGENRPSLIRKEDKPDYVEYVYNVPYGLVDKKELNEIIGKTFNRQIHIYFDGKLHIRLYKSGLKKKYTYDLFKPKEGWNVPIGMTQGGIVYHNFDDIPHMTVSGATTWGKTVFMKGMFTHLVENHPDDAEFYILDLKGGLAFHKYAKLKQVKVVAEDCKTSEKALRMVQTDIQKDMEWFKEKGYENVKEAGVKKRRFVIIDEAGELMPDDSMEEDEKKAAKKCQSLMSYIARVTGQLGVRMIFSTQYPTADIMDRQIKANSASKIAFRLETVTQSRVAIDREGAEKLPYPGRAIYKTVTEQIVQTPFITKDEIWKRIGRYEEDVTDTKKGDEGKQDTVLIGKNAIRNKGATTKG